MPFRFFSAEWVFFFDTRHLSARDGVVPPLPSRVCTYSTADDDEIPQGRERERYGAPRCGESTRAVKGTT